MNIKLIVYFLTSFYFIISTIACDDTKQEKIAPVVLNLLKAQSISDLSIPMTDSIDIWNQMGEIIASIPISDEDATLHLPEEGIYDLLYISNAPTYNYLSCSMYFTSGSSSGILIDAITDEFGAPNLSAQFSGDHTTINQYFAEKERLQEGASNDTTRTFRFISRARENSELLLDKLPNNPITSVFKEKESRSIIYTFYRRLYEVQNKRYDKLDGHNLKGKKIGEDNFPANHEEYNITNSDELSIPGYRDLVVQVIYLKSKYSSTRNQISLGRSSMEYISTMPDDKIKNYFTPKFYEWFHFPTKHGIEEFEHIYVLAQANLTDSIKIQKVKQIYTKAKKMAPGVQSPSFSLLNQHGKKVRSEDLLGSYVYMDIWATWCGPCKKEIPFLQKLEDDFAGRNIHFVSISTDKPNRKETWLKMIEEKSLGGIQLVADKEFMNKIYGEFYNIETIPHFILLDPEGKFIASKADRTSNPKTRQLLNELLNDEAI